MYSVVGCRECHALWIVEGRPETTNCPRCSKRYRFEKLQAFAETDSSDAAARVRSSMLAERSDEGEFVDPETIDVDSVGMDEASFLEASGIDPDAVAEAAERGPSSHGRSRKRVVLDAISELEEPTDEAVREYATAAGVPAEYVDRALEKLTRAGELTESGGVYRRL